MLGPNHPNVATSLNHLAELHTREGRYSDAELLFKRALAIQDKALGSEHPAVATTLDNLGLFCATEGKYKEAEPLERRALEIYDRTVGPDHCKLAAALRGYAALLEKLNRGAEAKGSKPRFSVLRRIR